MKYLLQLCLILFLFTNYLIAQYNSFQIDIDRDKIDSVFKDFEQPQTPGCAIGINHNTELVFARGYGTANLDYQIGITPKSRFMIASISKQFAAASLLMLEQEELLDLDEDLRPHISQISQFEEAITARQLIYHTSGIRDIYDLLGIADIGLDNTTTNEQALELLSRQSSLNFSPGTRHMYSNMAYFLMSEVVKQFSGMTLREYSHKHFFEPIGMNSTHWHDDTGLIIPDRVISYRPTINGPGMFYRGNMDRVGARGLFTTIEDFSKWDANFYENESNLENFHDKMVQPGYTTRLDSINYASGLRIGRYRTLDTIGHGGNYMGFRAHYVRFTDYDFSIFVFCNQSNISPAVYANKTADILLKNVFSEIFDEFTGTYRNQKLFSEFTIDLEEGNLILKQAFNEPKELLWVDGDVFRAGSWQFSFKRKENGDIDKMAIEPSGSGKFYFQRESNE